MWLGFRPRVGHDESAHRFAVGGARRMRVRASCVLESAHDVFETRGKHVCDKNMLDFGILVFLKCIIYLSSRRVMVHVPLVHLEHVARGLVDPLWRLAE